MSNANAQALQRLAPWSDDPAGRLRHTLEAYWDMEDDERAITATSGCRPEVGADWTGLTWGDLRQILDRLDGRRDNG